jgi:TRAP-type transport system small permease protein
MKAEQTSGALVAEFPTEEEVRVPARPLDVAMVAALGVMIVAVGLQVLYRYVLNDPLAGSEEIGRLAFIWVTFIGAVVATRDNLHVRIDYFVNQLKPCAARRCTLLSHVVTACFGVLMVWVGVQLSIFSWNYESASLQFPMTFVHAAVPVSGFLLAVFSIRALAVEARAPNKDS